MAKKVAAAENTPVRIDKWLWAARFFKTRTLAVKAVTGGRVHLNGSRVKAARMVAVGDRMSITIGSAEFVITVRALSDRRGPATVARTLYDEDEESIRRREEQRELRRMAGAGFSRPHGRPDKRARRKIREFIRKSAEAEEEIFRQS